MTLKTGERSNSMDFWGSSDAFSATSASTTARAKTKPAMTAKMAYLLKWSNETVNTCPSSIALSSVDSHNLDIDTMNQMPPPVGDDGCILITSPGIYQVQLVLFLGNQTSNRPEIQLKIDELTIAHEQFDQSASGSTCYQLSGTNFVKV